MKNYTIYQIKNYCILVKYKIGGLPANLLYLFSKVKMKGLLMDVKWSYLRKG